MTSQREERTRIRTGGYRRFRGEWVNDDLCGQSVIGRKLLKSFVNENIKSDKENIWSKMKKKKLLPYMEKQWKEPEGLSQRQSCGITGRLQLACPTEDGRQKSS